MSRYNYVITVKQPDYKNANAISLIMLLLAFIVFAYTAWIYWTARVYHNVAILYIVFGGFIALWCVYSLIIARRRKHVPYYRLAPAVAD